MLVIEYTLGGDNVRSVSTTDDDVCHYGDADVLFNIERSWIERPDTIEETNTSSGKDALESFTER